MTLHLNKLESPPPKDALCQVWLNWPTGSEERVENVKSLQTDRQTTDNRRSEKLTLALSSGELKKTAIHILDKRNILKFKSLKYTVYYS